MQLTMSTDELVEEVRKGQEAAWEQGFKAGRRYGMNDDSKEPENPYAAD